MDSAIEAISACALATWLADPTRARPLLLDVCEPWEFATCHLADSFTIPMRDVSGRLAEIDLDAPIVCICHHGARSLQAALFLKGRGATDVRNLTGGVAARALQVDPAFPAY